MWWHFYPTDCKIRPGLLLRQFFAYFLFSTQSEVYSTRPIGVARSRTRVEWWFTLEVGRSPPHYHLHQSGHHGCNQHHWHCQLWSNSNPNPSSPPLPSSSLDSTKIEWWVTVAEGRSPGSPWSRLRCHQVTVIINVVILTIINITDMIITIIIIIIITTIMVPR